MVDIKEHSGNISSVSRRIAKNTLLLYGRMFLLLVVSLYTSRVVLDALGKIDYGVYNAIVSLVALTAIASGAISTAVSRFLAYELVNRDDRSFSRVFSTAVIVQLLLIALLLLIGEPIFYYYLNYKMSLPPDSLPIANFILQTAIFSFAVQLLSLPYNSAIIANEKISAFAYISILEAILNLAIAFAISFAESRQLFIYASLMFIVKLIIRFIYGIYCKKKLRAVKFFWCWDSELLKKIFSLTGWLSLGNGLGIINSQGINQLINKFFGVGLNTATALASKVESAVSSFVNNFITAIQPQITKSYASGDMSYMHELMCKGAKFSYIIVFFFSLPLILETDTVLSIWLKGEIPEYTSILLKITLISVLLRSLGSSIVQGINATAKVKNYQIAVSVVALLAFPLSWYCFSQGAEVYVAFIILAIIDFIQIFVRVIVSRKETQLGIYKYFKDVLLRIILLSIASIIIPLSIYYIQEASYLRFVEIGFSSCISVLLSAYYIASTDGEKAFFKKKIKDILCIR